MKIRMIESEQTRVVRVARKPLLPPLAYHWSLQVGERWFEIAPMKETKEANKINSNRGSMANGTRSILTVEASVVGETTKTDNEIERWNQEWLEEHPEYELLTDNCQAYVMDLMVWLTDNNYRLLYNTDTADVDQPEEFWTNDGFEIETDGTAITSYTAGQSHGCAGPLNAKVTVGKLTTETVSTGASQFGAFVDATAAEVEANFGNAIGVSAGLKVDTGIGMRGGNAEAHVLGFGGKIGQDGLEVNTPLLGLRCCVIL